MFDGVCDPWDALWSGNMHAGVGGREVRAGVQYEGRGMGGMSRMLRRERTDSPSLGRHVLYVLLLTRQFIAQHPSGRGSLTVILLRLTTYYCTIAVPRYLPVALQPLRQTILEPKPWTPLCKIC